MKKGGTDTLSESESRIKVDGCLVSSAPLVVGDKESLGVVSTGWDGEHTLQGLTTSYCTLTATIVYLQVCLYTVD